jgi:tRNA(Ile)-lysidine synthase
MPDIRIGNDVLTFCVLDIEYEQGKEGMLESSPRRTSNTEAWFDLDDVQFPLIVRNRMDGDRIEPLGLNGSKKVKNMFIDAKVTPRQRSCIPLLVDFSQRLLWVAGFRQSKHAIVRTGMTKRILHVKFESEVYQQ